MHTVCTHCTCRESTLAVLNMPRLRITVLWRCIWLALICLAMFNVYMYVLKSDDNPTFIRNKVLIRDRSPLPTIVLWEDRDQPITEQSRDIPLVSEMKDTKHEFGYGDTTVIMELCKKKIQTTDWSDYPDVSVIISFHEVENVTNILRTVQAVLVRTPQQLLREVILVDDNAFKEDLRGLLPTFIKSHWGSRVRLYQSDTQLGLIRARQLGIREAKGQVVMVMDGHMERGSPFKPAQEEDNSESSPDWSGFISDTSAPLHGHKQSTKRIGPNCWLEPILHEIKENPNSMVSPHMDWIQRTGRKWTYRHGASSWSTHFDWSMVFGFFSSPSNEPGQIQDPTQPIRSSTSVGTFAIRKDFFLEIGGFDEGMKMWGGENIDLSIRVWLFGGQVVNSPCSHIAHVEAPNSRKYRDGWVSYINHNYKRVVEVWFDQYKKYFYEYFPTMNNVDVGDLSERMELKERSVYNFSWFLQHAVPEMGIPDTGLAWGGLRNLGTNLCIRASPHDMAGLTKCRDADTNQKIFMDMKGRLRQPLYILQIFSNQLKSDDWPKYFGSNTLKPNNWTHTKNFLVKSVQTNQCLEASPPKKKPAATSLILSPCKDHNVNQHWAFHHYRETEQNNLEQNRTSEQRNITGDAGKSSTLKNDVNDTNHLEQREGIGDTNNLELRNDLGDTNNLEQNDANILKRELNVTKTL